MTSSIRYEGDTREDLVRERDLSKFHLQSKITPPYWLRRIEEYDKKWYGRWDASKDKLTPCPSCINPDQWQLIFIE